MNITGLLKRHRNIEINVRPDEERTIKLPPNLGTGDAFADGCQLHAALLRFTDRKTLTPQERRLWPALAILRDELRELGAEELYPEARLRKVAELPAGRADVLMKGRKQDGLLELKVVSQIPTKPRGRDLVQVGAYMRHVLRERRFTRCWAVVAYVDLGRGEMRLFIFRRGIKDLVHGATSFLAA